MTFLRLFVDTGTAFMISPFVILDTDVFECLLVDIFRFVGEEYELL